MSLLPQATLPVPEFADEGQAAHWMYGFPQIEDYGCVDNFRFAFIDDAAAVLQYDQQRNEGCCGFFDRRVKVGGRFADIGCNYGH